MARKYLTFNWDDDEGCPGEACVSYGQWDHDKWPDDGVSLSIEGGYMDEQTATDFLRWLKLALSQAKRLHRQELDT